MSSAQMCCRVLCKMSVTTSYQNFKYKTYSISTGYKKLKTDWTIPKLENKLLFNDKVLYVESTEGFSEKGFLKIIHLYLRHVDS